MWRNMKNKIAKKNITIAIIILLVGLIIGLLIYNINKTKVFKATVNTLSNNLIEGLDNKNIDFLNIDGPTRFNFTFNEEDDLNKGITISSKVDLKADSISNKKGVSTGDNSNISLSCMLMTVSVLGLGLLKYLKRRALR